MQFVLGCTIVAVAVAQVRVKPVEKVIELMEDLKSQVENEGIAESASYDTFACFCRDKTTEVSSSITNGKQQIDIYSADIEANTKGKVVKEEDLEERKVKHEKMEKELDETKNLLIKEQAEYDAAAADLQKAIDSLQGAIQALNDAKTLPGNAFLELRRVVKTGSAIEKVLNNMQTPAASAVKAFLQNGVDPNSPEYKYHSQGIIDTLTDLETEFSNKKNDLDSEWTTRKQALDDTITDLGNAIINNQNAMDDLESGIENLKKTIAQDRESLVMDDATLKDAQVYLRDLTKRCEDRAKDWDQRSKMRADELFAITGALEILENEVKPADQEANKRALLQKVSGPRRAAAPVSAPASFVQINSHNAHNAALAAAQAKSNAIDMLTKESQRLKSEHLSMIAMQLTAREDPFTKVKVLIQKLIERLVQESIDEATKEGFCNLELGKAEQDRDFRFKGVMKLNTEIKGLELKRDQLDAEIQELEAQLPVLREDLRNATELRSIEHTQNMNTIATAKDGLEAITQAIVIIKTFYLQAGKAISLIQASPVDEDTQGPGFEGNYGGKQQASKGIIGMLEVIKTDFERTITKTTKSEEEAQADFIEFERATKTLISGKETKLELNQEDLKVTKSTITEKMDYMITEQGLLDAALKKLTSLKPMCIDFGQSYKDRVSKRQAEIAALERAICILAPANDPSVEPQCVGVSP